MSSVQADPARSFLVGETVHVGVRVSQPGTKTPTDPASVALASLKRDGNPVTIADPNFLRVAEGDYTYTIETAGMQTGTYGVLVRVSDGADKVVLVTDTFVLDPVP